jgi:hypothetical protein
MKKCSKCQIEKVATEFSKRNASKDGLQHQCKVCLKAQSKAWREANPDYQKSYREANPEKVKAQQKTWREANPEKVKAKNKAYRKNNPEKVKAWNEAYRKNNPDKVKAYEKSYYEANSEKKKSRGKSYYRANSDKIKKRNLAYQKNRYKSDPNYAAKCSARNLIGKAVRQGFKKDSPTEKLLGCSYDEFKAHIQSHPNWQPEWSWTEREGIWEIDHILPLSKVDWNDEWQVAAALHFTNLRPMSAKENLSRSNNLTQKEFEDVFVLKYYLS